MHHEKQDVKFQVIYQYVNIKYYILWILFHQIVILCFPFKTSDIPHHTHITAARNNICYNIRH